MYVVIFEVQISQEKQEEYLEVARMLKKQLLNAKGFISIERFSSLVNEEKIVSLSFWETQESIKNWKNVFDHRYAQEKGRSSVFKDYRIRIAKVQRDYSMENSDFKQVTQT